MLERDEYPAGVPCWVDVEQEDPEAATAFYGGLFGWEFAGSGDSTDPYFRAQLRGRDVAGIGQPAGDAPSTLGWNTFIAVTSADEAAAKAKAAGGSIVAEPFDVLDAGRVAFVADPAGAVFRVWEAKGRNGAQLVNEPATWNFSELNTRDPEGAKGFYRAVFGWELRSLAPDRGDSGFWGCG